MDTQTAINRCKALLPLFRLWQFFVFHAAQGSQTVQSLSENGWITSLCVVRRSPKLAQHANPLWEICRRIASTAYGRPQASISPSFSKRKLEEIGLQRAYPPDPLYAPKFRNRRCGISEFLRLKNPPAGYGIFQNANHF